MRGGSRTKGRTIARGPTRMAKLTDAQRKRLDGDLVHGGVAMRDLARRFCVTMDYLAERRKALGLPPLAAARPGKRKAVSA